MTRRPGLITVATCLILATAGCGGTDGGTDSGGTRTKVIEVTIEGDSVTPNGDRVQASVDQPIELDVTADAPGEIHVHSDPEQELEYDTGQTKITMTPIDHPGVVEVESHALEKTIVQLVVK